MGKLWQRNYPARLPLHSVLRTGWAAGPPSGDQDAGSPDHSLRAKLCRRPSPSPQRPTRAARPAAPQGDSDGGRAGPGQCPPREASVGRDDAPSGSKAVGGQPPQALRLPSCGAPDKASTSGAACRPSPRKLYPFRRLTHTRTHNAHTCTHSAHTHAHTFTHAHTHTQCTHVHTVNTHMHSPVTKPPSQQ